MSSEARKQAGEAFGGGDKEIELADPITPDNDLWRSGALIPASTVPDEELGYLTHHRIFACLSGICGLQEITLERFSKGGADEKAERR